MDISNNVTYCFPIMLPIISYSPNRSHGIKLTNIEIYKTHYQIFHICIFELVEEFIVKYNTQLYFLISTKNNILMGN